MWCMYSTYCVHCYCKWRFWRLYREAFMAERLIWLHLNCSGPRADKPTGM